MHERVGNGRSRVVITWTAITFILILFYLLFPSGDANGAGAKADEFAPYNTDPSRPRVGQLCFMDIAIDGVYIGRIVIGLFTETSPITAENFRSLTTGERGEHYTYKGTRFHRIIPDFIVQGGGLQGLTREQQHGLTFDDEPTALQLKHDARYLVQMANRGPDTNGSQFCFMLKASPHLNGKHAVFGRVVEGFDVVDRMEMAGTRSSQGEPTEEVVVIDCGEL